jgi:hypothetical protein
VIKLTKNGIWYSNDYCVDHEDYINEKVDSLIPYLSHRVEIEENFTLGDLFKIIEAEQDIYNTIFSSQLGHFPISKYIENLNMEIVEDKEEDDTTDIKYLEMVWICEIWDYDAMKEVPLSDFGKELGMTEEDRPSGSSFEFYCAFHGYGKWRDDNVSEGEWVDGGIAIGLTQLNELKDFPIVLNKNINIYTYESEPNPRLTPAGEKYFKVYDVVGEILSEVSFYGLPEDKDEVLEDVIEKRDEIKNKISEEDKEEDCGSLAKKAIKKIRDGKDLRSEE